MGGKGSGGNRKQNYVPLSEDEKKIRRATSQRVYDQSVKGKARHLARQENPECRALLKEYHNKYDKRRRKENRLLVFAHYGGKCSWPGCNITDEEMLEMHHSNGDGAKHRKEQGMGSTLHQWLISCNFPPGFELLCANHHRKRHANMARAAARKEGAKA